MKGFIETHDLVSGFLPVNMATAANTGDAVSLKDYGGCVVVFFKGPGANGEDPTITLLQGTDVAFGTSKALNFTTIYRKQAATVLTAVTEWTATTQSAANTYTQTDAGEAAAIWAIEVDAADLDTDNGYDCIQASVGDVGSTSQIGCILYIMTQPRYPQASPVDAITD